MARRDYVPRPYQGPITEHILEHERCQVWSGMGTGKGVAALTAIDILRIVEGSEPWLVLGPLRVARDVWSTETRKWTHLHDIDVMPIIGSEQERRLALKHDCPVYSCNYENLEWLVEHFGDRWPFRNVIPDEVTRLAGFRLKQGTARSRALGRVAHTKIRRLIGLTGTPAPNGLKKLWGPMWFVDAGKRLGRSYSAFTQRWFQKSFDGFGVDPLPFAREQIEDALRDVCLSIDFADYYDVSEPIVQPVYVELPVKARMKYREMERQLYTELEGHGVEAFNAAAKTQKLLQLANGAAYIGEASDPGERKWIEVHDAKLQALESIVEEANGMPILCAYEFKSDRIRILREFPKFVDLATDAGMKTFLAGKAQGGLAHPRSLGHGIDGLQYVTNILALYGQNWDLELYDQLVGRIGPVRQMQAGLKRAVFVYPIIAIDTADELVMARRESKREVQDLLLEAMKR